MGTWIYDQWQGFISLRHFINLQEMWTSVQGIEGRQGQTLFNNNGWRNLVVTD